MTTLQSKLCSVPDCNEFIRCKGLCPFHYHRKLKGIALDARASIPRVGPCLIDGCDLPRRSRGLCARHYDHARNSTECPTCGKRKTAAAALCSPCAIAEMQRHFPAERTCTKCQRTQPADAFGLRPGGQGRAKWRSRCRECENLEAKERREAKRLAGVPRGDRSGERAMAPYLGLRSYARKLGIPWAEIVERYPSDNRCNICHRTPLEASPSGRYVRLSLDHCHETGQLRGFLCAQCNKGLGNLGDTTDDLRRALAYLEHSDAAGRL